ncbi:MAG: divergent polysaccharide deacetylase family protein [Holosporaceae bacterium]|jgi:hypothetical protein|nr:divergent polysaccharide deacetylase family protein [Holosporaceae bacterium]
MRENKTLLWSWISFIIVLIIFIAMVEAYHHIKKERSYDYQCRILINKNTVVESEDDLIKPNIKEKKDSDDKFYEDTKYGYLPKISPDGGRVFDEYSAVVTIKNDFKKIRLAILVNNSSIDNLLKTVQKWKITFIIPNYLDNFSEVIQKIRKEGHEFFLQIPTQSSIPAEKKTIVSPFLANSNDTIDKLLYLLSSCKYAIGIANVTPTLITKSKNDVCLISNELSKRGLAFLNIEKPNDLFISQKNELIYINITHIFDEKTFNKFSINNGDILLIDQKDVQGFIRNIVGECELIPVSAFEKE